jgi:hypothetical protein
MTEDQITYYRWQEFKFILAVGVLWGFMIGVYVI